MVLRMGYGGFTNFETYLVANWLNQNDAKMSLWKKRVHQLRGQSDMANDQLISFQLQLEICAAISKGCDEDASSIAFLLVDAAFRRVDWQEIHNFVEACTPKGMAATYPQAPPTTPDLKGPPLRDLPMDKSPMKDLAVTEKVIS